MILTDDVLSALSSDCELTIRIGDELREAKASCFHGEWLPYCAEYYPRLAFKTIQLYMRCSKYAEKYPDINYQNLAPTTLYDISAPCNQHKHKMIKTVIDLAKTRYVPRSEALTILYPERKNQMNAALEELGMIHNNISPESIHLALADMEEYLEAIPDMTLISFLNWVWLKGLEHDNRRFEKTQVDPRPSEVD